MIFFVRSSLSKFDSRIQKYFKCIETAKLEYTYIGWIRGDLSYKPQTNEILFLRQGKLGAGWFNALDIILWNIFLFYKLCMNSRNIKIVHAVDLDSALICYIYCRVFRKKIIFDVYDKYTAVRNLSGMPGRFLDNIEKYIAKYADLTLLAGPERNVQLGINEILPNMMILENVPSMDVSSIAFPSIGGKWRIGYFGVLEPNHRGLEDLLSTAANRDDIELHIAGYGGLQKLVNSYSDRFDHISYHGILDSLSGLRLMADMHVIVGMYYLSIPNHFYASPNKYYEHLMLGRSLLTTKNTAPGNRVEAYNTGWAIDEGIDAIKVWLDTLTAESVLSSGREAHALWSAKYSDYYREHYQGKYMQHIKEMLGIKI